MQIFATLMAIMGAVVALVDFLLSWSFFFDRLHTDFFVVYDCCVLWSNPSQSNGKKDTDSVLSVQRQALQDHNRGVSVILSVETEFIHRLESKFVRL